jgi:Kef-type K+ transport system membrane component KefB
MNREIKHFDSRFAIYPLCLVLFGAALWLILLVGTAGQPSLSSPAIVAATSAPSYLSAELYRNLRSPLGILLLQILAIIAFTRCCAKVIRKFGQPEVIGEVIGGILLGPSVLGLLWPAAGALLFPATSLANLGLLSQIGLIVFMFVVGMELDTEILTKKVRSAVLISHTSIILPFLLGSLLSLFLYKDYAPVGVHFTPFCLFMGIAMSITAFPVLARILHERGLSRSPLGTVVLTCAAVDDLTAWCGLAVVAAVSQQGTIATALITVAFCGLHIALMFFVIQPLLRRWINIHATKNSHGKGAIAAVLFTVFFSALMTEAIGIHALFGAFLAGIVIPKKSAFRSALLVRLESFSTIILLPLFFALSGLRTQISVLNDPASWILCGIVILVAITGKFIGSAAAARWSGSTWRESLAIGALMNTRGLVELVALNIGYDLGIITPTIFTIMVLMALVTTLMTGPLLSFLMPDARASSHKKATADAYEDA